MIISSIIKRQIGLLIILSCLFLNQSFAAAKITGLKCEYLINPLGIDAPHPRLMWVMDDNRQGAKQTAYQLSVSTDSVELTKSIANTWQTTKVISDASRILYNGKTLQPYTKYFWRVAVWDKDGKLTTSPIASFETGLMSKSNWQGTWISDDYDAATKPAPYFRHVFQADKKIKSARAYIAVAGLYELYVNGQKIGNHRLDPMYTRFDRRTLYVTYDVTAQMQTGQNAVGVLLGNGWYNHQSTAVWDFHKAPWRNRPAFCLDLRVTYEDGSIQTFTSGKNWKTALSPIIFNSIYTAEHYDARLEQLGWNIPNFIDTAWKSVIIRSAPSMNIVSQELQPIRLVEKIPAKSIKKLDDKTYLFDLGRNIAGISALTVKGEAGTVIRLKHAEKLDKNGRADQSNIDIHYRPTDDKDPFQTDIYILNGGNEETFAPHFNYKGF